MKQAQPTSKSLAGSVPALLLAFAMLCASVIGVRAAAEYSTNQPLPGVAFSTETRQDPPTRLFIAEVDLTDPNVHIRVAPGGPDPDGPGKWQTTLMTPTKVAAREGFDLVINGDFFNARGTKNAEGTNANFQQATWASVAGPAVTDGRVWATSTNPRPCLVVHKNQKLTIEMLSRPSSDDWEVMAGNTMLVKDGKAVPQKNKQRHPRTVVGLDAKKTKLILLIVDGRKPGIAVGMTYEELATEMLKLGCHQALNLDGGGSTIMAVRDLASGNFHLLNEPTDGRERAVGNVLGISIGSPVPNR